MTTNLAPPRRRRGGRDDGAAAVEFALVSLLLALLLAGLAEYGLAFNTSRTAARGTSDAARLAASIGDGQYADYNALRSLAASVGRTDAAVNRVIVYRTSAANGAVPATCWTASQTGVCNSYAGTALDALDMTEFPSDCTGSHASWCPLDRQDAYDDGDYLGVAVELSRSPLFGGFFAGNTIRRHAVYRLEVQE
ncbi:MAG: TadE/TadG family type IV pilus assembly protein [Acidimicrobiales bacterium]